MTDYDSQKISKLVQWLMLLNISSVIDSERLEQAMLEAPKLARELFPVRAKPLVWFGERSADYRVFEVEQNQWLPQLRNFSSWSPRYALIGDVCTTEDEAKAACESHHQSRFLEQLA